MLLTLSILPVSSQDRAHRRETLFYRGTTCTMQIARRYSYEKENVLYFPEIVPENVVPLLYFCHVSEVEQGNEKGVLYNGYYSCKYRPDAPARSGLRPTQ